MEHTPFIEKISLWLDNELSPAEVRELQLHLAKCSSCTQTYKAMQQVDTLLREASSAMAQPAAGFTARFESRLAHYTSRNRWHMWLGLGVLLLATLFFLITGAVVGGITLLNIWATLIDMQILYYWLGAVGQAVNEVRALVTLGSLLLRIVLMALGQPALWLSIPIAAVLIWLWLRVMQGTGRRLSTTVKMLI